MNKTILTLASAIMLASGGVAFANSNAPMQPIARPIVSTLANQHNGSNVAEASVPAGKTVRVRQATLIQHSASHTPAMTTAELALSRAAG